jgi:hypothetical protein
MKGLAGNASRECYSLLCLVLPREVLAMLLIGARDIA